MKIDCTSGDVTLSPVHNSGMTVDYKTASGKLHGQDKQKAYHTVIGDGASAVTVSTTSGDLKISDK